MNKKQKDTNLVHIACERAIDELRRQMGIVVEKKGFFPAEALTAEQFRQFQGESLQLAITAPRANSLKLGNTFSSDVIIHAKGIGFDQLHYLADPLAPKTSLPALDIRPATNESRLALMLGKFASLLPALLVFENVNTKNAPFNDWHSVSASDIEQFIHAPEVEVDQTAAARLPLEGAEQTTLVSFRVRHSATVHLALVVGDITTAKTPLVRIHSSCVTGDILGSLRCDCGDQLRLSLEEIIAAGAGVLVYLHQEGRSIGITNKLRAYALQEQGFDTYEANLLLGFGEDERDFSIAAVILKTLGITHIRLLTNNPAKIEALEKQGIHIAARVPLKIKTGKHNHAYLDAKAKKSGHLF